jgi:hypothetical protein
MDCSFIRRNLFTYQEHKLSDKDNKEFEAHLLSCAECSGIVSEFQAVTSVIDLRRNTEPNAFAGTRIIQRLDSEMEGIKKNVDPIILRIIQPLAVAALLVIAVIIGFSIVNNWEPEISAIINHQQDIRAIQSDLNIPDFVDEDDTFFANK